MFYKVGSVSQCPYCQPGAQGHFFYPNRQMQCGVQRFQTTGIVRTEPDGSQWCGIVGHSYSDAGTSTGPSQASPPPRAMSATPPQSPLVGEPVTPPPRATSIPGAPPRLVGGRERYSGVTIPSYAGAPDLSSSAGLAGLFEDMGVQPVAPGTMPGVVPLPQEPQPSYWVCRFDRCCNLIALTHCRFCGRPRL